MNNNEIRYYVNRNTSLISKSSGSNYKTKSNIRKSYSQQNQLLPTKLSSKANPKRKIGASLVCLLLLFSPCVYEKEREELVDGER
jgi:hypothetical protein